MLFPKCILVWMMVGLARPMPKSPPFPPDVFQAIVDVLNEKSDERSAARYLTTSLNKLRADLPINPEGQVTFFAPSNFAFSNKIPQDIADPFFVDEKLRSAMLFRHFVLRQLTLEDLSALGEVTAADSTKLPLTGSGGNIKINDAKIKAGPFDVQVDGVSVATVYVIDRVFVSTDDVQDAISRFPPEVACSSPFGNLC